jgi:hypothetical protein
MTPVPMTPVPMIPVQMIPGWIGPLAGSVGPLGAAVLIGLVTLRRLLPRGIPVALAGGVMTGLVGGIVTGGLARWLSRSGEGGTSGELHGFGLEAPAVGGLLSTASILVYALALGVALRCWRVPVFELMTLVLLLPGLAFQLLMVTGVVAAPPPPVLPLLPPADFMLDLRSRADGVVAPGFWTGAAVWALHVTGLLALASWGRRGADSGRKEARANGA